MTYERVIRNIPRTGELLAKYGGVDVIDRIGHDVVKDGDIVQMSMTHWPQEVARILEDRIGLKHPITKMPAAESLRYVKTCMKTVDLHAVMA